MNCAAVAIFGIRIRWRSAQSHRDCARPALGGGGVVLVLALVLDNERGDYCSYGYDS